jgi:hypothetical protein
MFEKLKGLTGNGLGLFSGDLKFRKILLSIQVKAGYLKGMVYMKQRLNDRMAVSGQEQGFKQKEQAYMICLLFFNIGWFDQRFCFPAPTLQRILF